MRKHHRCLEYILVLGSSQRGAHQRLRMLLSIDLVIVFRTKNNIGFHTSMSFDLAIAVWIKDCIFIIIILVIPRIYLLVILLLGTFFQNRYKTRWVKQVTLTIMHGKHMKYLKHKLKSVQGFFYTNSITQDTK